MDVQCFIDQLKLEESHDIQISEALQEYLDCNVEPRTAEGQKSVQAKRILLENNLAGLMEGFGKTESDIQNRIDPSLSTMPSLDTITSTAEEQRQARTKFYQGCIDFQKQKFAGRKAQVQSVVVDLTQQGDDLVSKMLEQGPQLLDIVIKYDGFQWDPEWLTEAEEATTSTVTTSTATTSTATMSTPSSSVAETQD